MANGPMQRRLGKIEARNAPLDLPHKMVQVDLGDSQEDHERRKREAIEAAGLTDYPNVIVRIIVPCPLPDWYRKAGGGRGPEQGTG